MDCEPSAEDLFDAAVAVATRAIDVDAETLAPEERAAVGAAVAPRQREFATGRAVARALLERLGVERAVLPAGADGVPIWPAGFVGSISHGGGRCAVAVARACDMRSLGIDIEPDDGLDPTLWEWICTLDERRWLARHDAVARDRFARVLFSAKEAAGKCLYPLWHRFIDPRELEIAWEPPLRRFRVRAGPALLEGSALVGSGWILTGVAIRTPP